MRGKRCFLWIVGIFTLLMMIAAGCAPARRPMTPETEPRPGVRTPLAPGPARTPGPAPGTPGLPAPGAPGTPATPAPTPGAPGTRALMPTGLADTIADEVTAMPGVRSASVLIVGRTAFIGVDLENEMNAGRVESLKNQIANNVRNRERINEVLVSADPAITRQIRDIAEGRTAPTAIGDLFTRMKPQM